MTTANLTGNKPLKVLLLLHELSRTGAPKIAIESMKLLNGQVSTLAIAYQMGEMASDVASFAPLYYAPQPPAPATGNRLARLRHRLKQKQQKQWWQDTIAAFAPDVIYANSVASLPIASLIDLPDVPVLLHVHELDMLAGWYDRPNPWRFREWPTGYIAVADAVRQMLINSMEIAPEKIRLVPEFFDESILTRSTEPVTKHPGVFTVGGAGRIQWRKGFELWLQTAVLLKASMPHGSVHFVWVGGENDMHEAEMRLTAKKLGVDDIVDILPMTPDPVPAYLEFDTFLMTSWEDPFPIVVLETMALGIPCICIAGSGGPSEQVADTGIVVPRFNASLLAEAVLQLQSNPELRQVLGHRACARATANFTRSQVAPMILEALKEAASTARK